MNNIILGSRILEKGSEGKDVELLQNLLKVLPDEIGSSISKQEIFGLETQTASPHVWLELSCRQWKRDKKGGTTGAGF
ncbi:MAG: hypothetical protein GX119_04865 [Syntrophomonadaceae bacterium]|nr:hypothetical protein [Syntrophomonadaceae bacterium]